MTVSRGSPYLPTNTIVPENDNLFVPYFNRTYEDIALIVNNKDNIFYPMAITDTAQDILNLPTFGSFIICVSGVIEGLPTITASLTKASTTSSGSIAVLGSQTGNISPWGGSTLTITSTATHFQIQHSVTGRSGNFNIKFIGTQQVG